MKHCLLVSLFFALTCCAQLGNKPANWKSVYREITFDYSDPWSLLPTLDTKEKTLSGVIDNRDGKSYIIHITDDVSKGQLSDEVYFKGIEQTMLRANKNNRLISENDTTFHGINAHSQVYLMHTDKWGMLKQINFVIRIGTEFASIQILFPTTKEKVETEPLPSQIIGFDKTLRMKLK